MNLPVLEEKLGIDRFELHLIGSKKHERFNSLYSKSYVKARGYVDDIGEEFLTCDILLSLTPFKSGLRIRILEGFRYGCCIVTTKYDQDACPLLEHRRNALIADQNSELGALIIEALVDEELRSSLGRNARRTYEKNCTSEVACRVYEKDMLQLVARFNGPN